MTLEELKTMWKEFLYLEDDRVVDVILAITMANLKAERDGWDSLNLFLVGAQGTGKTELINSLDRVPGLSVLDYITSNAFLSGYRESKRNPVQHSLLIRLQQAKIKMLIIKDMTTIFSMQPGVRAEILSQIRRISDGSISKRVGNEMSVSWEGKLGFLAATTYKIDASAGLIGELGERWLYWRMDQPDCEEMSKMAQRNIGREGELRKRLKLATLDLITERLNQAKTLPVIELQEETAMKIRGIARMASWARSIVPRDVYRKEIEYEPVVEPSARLTKHMTQMACALAIIHGTNQVTESIIEILMKMAVDNIPGFRKKIICALWENENDWTPTGTIAKVLPLSLSPLWRLLEDLQALGILERKDSENLSEWRMSEEVWERLKQTGLMEVSLNGTRRKA